jgi:hypothetical protein
MKLTTEQNHHTTPVLNKRLQQLGMAGFGFFLVKGLAWVAIAVWSILNLS